MKTIASVLSDHSGNIPIIKTNLVQVLKDWGQVGEDHQVVEETIRVLLVFEYYQPNLGYVPGMEKIAYYLRKLSDEPTAFHLFFNILFNSKLIWGFLEAKKTITEQNLSILEKMCNRYPNARKSYEVNRLPLEKFFLEYGCFLYLDVFDPTVVE